jgi:acyl-CoA hydrolase
MCDISFVNQVAIVAQNPKVTAINSCIEVDLTGQVCSDSIGTRMYSGKCILKVFGFTFELLTVVDGPP